MEGYLRVDCSRCDVKCCIDQRVILSERDIDLLVSKGYKLDSFAVKRGSFYYLREYGGKCVFYDEMGRRCRIYEYRPLVCRLYPLVYQDKHVILDIENCPEAKNIGEDELWNAIPDLIELVFNLKKGYSKY